MAEPDMQLPPGKTCGDCRRWPRCKAFISSLRETNTTCDWSPSAFIQKPEAEVSEQRHDATAYLGLS